MIISVVSISDFNENCYIVGEKKNGAAVVIDPGNDVERILAVLERHSLTCELILHTHAHIDHCMASEELRRIYHAACAVPEADRELWQLLPIQAHFLGLAEVVMPQVDRWVKDGDIVKWGVNMSLEVIDTPGHTPGGVTYRLKREKESDIVFVGDSIHCGSIGRTDLGGDSNQLIRSIKRRLFTLPDDTVVLSGHGPATSIGRERKMNLRI